MDVVLPVKRCRRDQLERVRRGRDQFLQRKPSPKRAP